MERDATDDLLEGGTCGKCGRCFEAPCQECERVAGNFYLVAFAVLLGLLALFAALLPARAQAIGGNASLAVTSASSNVQLPASLTTYPVVLLTQAPGSTQEVFFALGTTNAVAATAGTSPALPQSVGTCVNVGPNGWIAAVTASATATLRITQMTTCPVR